MSSEVGMTIQVTIGMGIVIVSSLFFTWGGRSIEELHKWHLDIFGDKSNRIWGRIIAPLFLSISMILLSLFSIFSWWYCLGIAAYLVVARLGYGGDKLWEKIIRRAIWSLLFTAASLVYVFGSINPSIWIVYVTQVLIGIIVAVLWGVTNPVLAPREEYMIKLSNILFIPLMIL